ncbi:MAG: ATPase, T2SS/T4P/T4SS family, partial [Patescibacteria group bacterium]
MNIKEILNASVEKKASDVHLVVGLPPYLRVDGELVSIDDKPVTSKEMEQAVFSLVTLEQKEKFLTTRELDFGYELNGLRFRVNLHYERGNIGLVARVISDEMPTLEDLNMPPIVYSLLGLDQGLILVTGPTGCCKSTTLAAMLNYINSNRSCNIITL